MEKHLRDQALLVFLTKEKVATMQELKKKVGVDTDISIYRALKRLSYRTSYSHGSRYYALSKVVHFDDDGLWSARSVWFSKHGTLSKTLEKLVDLSERGCFADELESRLHVGVRESLLRLVNQERVQRERISRSYLYVSKNSSIRRRQLASYLAKEGAGCGLGLLIPEVVSEEVKAAIVLFAALLDEKQRRLFAGLETIVLGRNAETWIADILGVHRQTVAKGRRELLNGDIDFDRVRKKGAGRPLVEKKRPRS
ncbi:MAG: hypothetical protein GY847_12555 [Proteobacteria bacterium]|nr:hypothetical protein [Pseudomonadota bacterium]